MSTPAFRRHHRDAVRQSNRKAESAIANLSAEERTVRERITELERFIVKAPELAERAQNAQRERRNTLPPPEEFLPEEADSYDGERDPALPRLRRAQEALLRRRRAMNLAVFVVVALALAGFVRWIAENL